MSVYKRNVKDKFGTHKTKDYHYKFMRKGEVYCGVCKGCTTKTEAEEYERRIIETLNQANQQQTIENIIEMRRRALSGGEGIALTDAFDKFLTKPVRGRRPSERQIKNKLSWWSDFIYYMEVNFPQIKLLSSVEQIHAESYIGYIQRNGRAKKELVYYRAGKEIKTVLKSNLASRTIIFAHEVCAEVFNALSKDAGMHTNPFDFGKIMLESETREVFTAAEINLILEKADDFMYPLFVIALSTALREGDICTLKWENINLADKLLTCKTRKTGQDVSIDISKIVNLFNKLKQNNDTEWILPKHAQMYLNDPQAVSHRVKKFLESIGIVTTKKVDGRDRVVSIKDLHSCRHTFCYNAAQEGAPLAVIQSIVGHSSQIMTRHYANHANDEARRNAMMLMKNYLPQIAVD